MPASTTVALNQASISSTILGNKSDLYAFPSSLKLKTQAATIGGLGRTNSPTTSCCTPQSGTMMEKNSVADDNSSVESSAAKSPVVVSLSSPALKRTCEPCTAAKVKCDGMQPCSRCRRRCEESSCMFRPQKKRGRRVQLNTHSNQDSSYSEPHIHAHGTTQPNLRRPHFQSPGTTEQFIAQARALNAAREAHRAFGLQHGNSMSLEEHVLRLSQQLAQADDPIHRTGLPSTSSSFVSQYQQQMQQQQHLELLNSIARAANQSGANLNHLEHSNLPAIKSILDSYSNGNQSQALHHLLANFSQGGSVMASREQQQLIQLQHALQEINEAEKLKLVQQNLLSRQSSHLQQTLAGTTLPVPRQTDTRSIAPTPLLQALDTLRGTRNMGSSAGILGGGSQSFVRTTSPFSSTVERQIKRQRVMSSEASQRSTSSPQLRATQTTNDPTLLSDVDRVIIQAHMVQLQRELNDTKNRLPKQELRARFNKLHRLLIHRKCAGPLASTIRWLQKHDPQDDAGLASQQQVSVVMHVPGAMEPVAGENARSESWKRFSRFHGYQEKSVPSTTALVTVRMETKQQSNSPNRVEITLSEGFHQHFGIQLAESIRTSASIGFILPWAGDVLAHLVSATDVGVADLVTFVELLRTKLNRAPNATRKHAVISEVLSCSSHSSKQASVHAIVTERRSPSGTVESVVDFAIVPIIKQDESSDAEEEYTTTAKVPRLPPLHLERDSESDELQGLQKNWMETMLQWLDPNAEGAQHSPSASS